MTTQCCRMQLIKINYVHVIHIKILLNKISALAGFKLAHFRRLVLIESEARRKNGRLFPFIINIIAVQVVIYREDRCAETISLKRGDAGGIAPAATENPKLGYIMLSSE